MSGQNHKILASVKTALCRHLEQAHKGEKEVVSSRQLENFFHLKGSELRRLVNILRCEGKPICSNAMGYFYAATQQELQETISQLTSRIQMIAKARDGLMKYLDEHAEGRTEDEEY